MANVAIGNSMSPRSMLKSDVNSTASPKHQIIEANTNRDLIKSNQTLEKIKSQDMRKS